MKLHLITLLCIQWKGELSCGDLITIVALGIAIWQFSQQMKESRSSAKKLQKENWYLNIIVLPQLEIINNNYIKLIDTILEKRKHLVKVATEKSQKEFRRECAKIKNHIKKKNINEQFDHIIALVRSYNNNLATEANDIILQLEDLCTNFVDRYDDTDEFLKIRSSILQNKETLISILNKGLNSNEE